VTWLLIGAALLFVALRYGPKLAQGDRRVLSEVLRNLSAAIAIGFGLSLIARGAGLLGAPLLIIGLVGLFPTLRLGKRLLGGLGLGGPPPVETAWVRMTLDQAARPFDGVVKQGAYAGRRLSDLSEVQVRAVLAEAQAADVEATALLTAYVARRFAGGGGRNAPARRDVMSEEEALAILGLARGATPDEVQAAYKRLMVKVHPDQGGSSWLAAKLNAARERLLEK
jgi:hypothetical protein